MRHPDSASFFGHSLCSNNPSFYASSCPSLQGDMTPSPLFQNHLIWELASCTCDSGSILTLGPASDPLGGEVAWIKNGSDKRLEAARELRVRPLVPLTTTHALRPRWPNDFMRPDVLQKLSMSPQGVEEPFKQERRTMTVLRL